MHTRFVLEHVPDPINVVKQMLRAAKEGGRIILADDDHDVFRVYPEVPGFTELWNAYMQTYTKVGNDPLVGRKLVSLLHDAGARPVRNTWIFFGDCSGNKRFNLFVSNLVGVIAGAKEQMFQHKLFDEKRFDQILSSFQIWKQRPDAALWYAVAWAEGVRSK